MRWEPNANSALLYASGRLDGDPAGGFSFTPEVDFRPLAVTAGLHGADGFADSATNYLVQETNRVLVGGGAFPSPTGIRTLTYDKWSNATTGSSFGNPFVPPENPTTVDTIISDTVMERRWYRNVTGTPTLGYIDTITLSNPWSMADLDDWLLGKLAAFDWSVIPLDGITELGAHGEVLNQRLGLLYSASLDVAGELVLGPAPSSVANFSHPFPGHLLQADMRTLINSASTTIAHPRTLTRTAIWCRPLGGYTKAASNIFTGSVALPDPPYGYTQFIYLTAGYPQFYGSKTGPFYGDWSSSFVLTAPSYRSWNPSLCPPPYFGGQIYSATVSFLRQCEDKPFLRSIRTNYSLEPTLELKGSAGGRIQIDGMWLPRDGDTASAIRLVPVGAGTPLTLAMVELEGPRNEFWRDTDFGAPRIRDYYPAHSSNPAENADGLPWLPASGFNGALPADAAYRTQEWAAVPAGTPPGDYWLEVSSDLGTASSADMKPPQAITVL